MLAITRVHPNAPAEGTVFAEGRIAGPAARPAISAALRVQGARVGWFRPGDGRADVRLAPDLDALLVDRVDWPFPGGVVRARGKVAWPRGTVALEWDVETAGLDLADALESVGIEGSWVTVRLDAKGRIAGTVWPTLALGGGITGDFRDLRTYTQAARSVKPGTAPVVEVKRGRLDAPLRVGPEGLTFDGTRVTAGRGTSTVDAVARLSAAGGFQVRWRGQVDLDAIGRVGGVPVGGLAEVDSTLAAAPYGNPHAVGRARAEGLRFLDIALGTASCEFDYGPDFLVRVKDAEGVFRQTRWRGEGVVDLEASPVHVRRMQLAAKGQVRDLFDAVQDWVPRTRQFRNAVDGEIEVSATGSGPGPLLDGTFDARMATGTFYGRPFDSARMTGTYQRGDEARYERVELRRGAGVARMTGRYGFSSPFPWDLDVSFAGVSLADAGLPGGSDWGGSASGTIALRGSFEHPDVRFAANGDGVSIRGTALGSLQAAGTVKGQDLVVTGGADGLRFEAEARLDGRMPFRARADVTLEDVARYLPAGAPGLKARVKGEATAEGELTALDLARARVRLDEVQAGHAEFKVRAAAPVVITASRGRVDVQALTLVGPNTELTVSGARAASGQLDLTAAGTADLRLLAGLVPDLKRPHGQLAVEAHVTGTLETPVLVGSGRLAEAGFQLKTTSILFSDVRGALAFSQNRVLFEDLSASVNGGRARLRGELELASFVPVRLRVEALLDEVPVAVPAYLPVTLSGRIEAAGTPDATVVTGRLHVVRARYTADVGLEKNLLELRRRPPPAPRPYDKSGEWLRLDLQVVVDGDARVENDLVSGAVRGELTLTGTLAAPGVVGTLAMADGSRARFRGNEFSLTHAVLDFTERNRMEIALDVHGRSQVRDYEIFMHAFGPLSEPQLTLTSNPALSQPDIITLLSLGFTRRDAAAGAGVQGVATAAAAQALFSASGLDEQVRRFLPRNQMVPRPHGPDHERVVRDDEPDRAPRRVRVAPAARPPPAPLPGAALGRARAAGAGGGQARAARVGPVPVGSRQPRRRHGRPRRRPEAPVGMDRRLALIAAALLAATGARGDDAVAAAPRVAAVELRLPPGEDPAAAAALLAIEAGEPLSSHALRLTVQRLYQVGRYRNVVVRAVPAPPPDGAAGEWVRLVVEALPIRTLAALRIRVVDGPPAPDAAALGAAAGVQPGDPFDDADLDRVAARVKAALARRGFRDARVEASGAGDRQVTAELVVSPGEPVRVASLRLGGDPGPRAAALAAGLTTRAGALLDDEALEADVRRLRAELYAAGHRRARISRPVVSIEGRRATVEIPVEAGPRIAFAFRGNAEVPSAVLERELGLEEGLPVDLPAVGAAADRLLAFYRARGHAAVRVDPREVRRGRDLVIVFHVDEGRRFRVARVAVEGLAFRDERWVRERLFALLDEDVREPATLDADEGRALLLSIPDVREGRTPPPALQPHEALEDAAWDRAAERLADEWRTEGFLEAVYLGASVSLDAQDPDRRDDAAVQGGAAHVRRVDRVRGKLRGRAHRARPRGAARPGRAPGVREDRGDPGRDPARVPLPRAPLRPRRGPRAGRSRAAPRRRPLRRRRRAPGEGRPGPRHREPPDAGGGGPGRALALGGRRLRSRPRREEPGRAAAPRGVPVGRAARPGAGGPAGDEGPRGGGRGAALGDPLAGRRLLDRERSARVHRVGAAEPPRPRARADRPREGELSPRRVPARPPGQGLLGAD